MLRIRLLNPTTESARIEEFSQRQRACYAAFAVQQAAKKIDGRTDGSVYFVVAETLSGEMVGGTRFHVRGKHTPLPIELAMSGNKRISNEIRARQHEGVAEYAGLWVLPDQRGTGLSAALMSTAVASSAAWGVRHGLGFTHHYLIFWTPIGFQVDQELGFTPYPDPRYQSYVLWIDPLTLANARLDYQRGISMIRDAVGRERAVLWDPQGGHGFDEQLHVEDGRMLASDPIALTY